MREIGAMISLGSVPASTTIYIPFTTYGGANGESITCSGLAVTDIEIYKNGSTTQRSSDAGYALLDTDGIDFDGITGLHGFSIDLSDNTDSGFYAVGSWYWVVVSAITVDSQTVTFLAAVFRICPAEGITGHPKTDVGGWLGTAPATPTVPGVPEVDITHLLGTAHLAPGTAGTPDVNAKLLGATVQTGSDVGAKVTALTKGLIAGVVASSSSTTVVNITSTESGLAVTDQLKGRVIIFNKDTTTAALRGQGAPIDSSDTTSITVASGDAFTTAPASGDTFTIY